METKSMNPPRKYHELEIFLAAPEISVMIASIILFLPPFCSASAFPGCKVCNKSEHPSRSQAPPRKRLCVSFAACIGAGKSTTAKALARKLGWAFFEEPFKKNEFLKPFYASGCRKHVFDLQKRFMQLRVEQQQEIDECNKSSAQARSYSEDLIFIEMAKDNKTLNLDEYNELVDAHKKSLKSIGKPDVIVYLDIDPELAMERIRKRGRPMEKFITIEYIRDLLARYEQWLKYVRVIVVKCARDKDVAQVVDEIRAKLKADGLPNGLSSMDANDLAELASPISGCPSCDVDSVPSTI